MRCPRARVVDVNGSVSLVSFVNVYSMLNSIDVMSASVVDVDVPFTCCAASIAQETTLEFGFC